MTRTLVGFLSSIAVASTVLAAQGTTPQNPPASPDPQKPATADVTMTGCMIQGSGPSVFILDNARANAQDRSEKTQAFVVVAGTEDLNLASNLNHEVSISGTPDWGTVQPPAGQKAAEKDLPKLKARSLVAIADTCTAATR